MTGKHLRAEWKQLVQTPAWGQCKEQGTFRLKVMHMVRGRGNQAGDSPGGKEQARI